MTCTQFKKLIDTIGPLSATETQRDQFDGHIKACPACRSFLHQMTVSRLQNLPEAELLAMLPSLGEELIQTNQQAEADLLRRKVQNN